jgi:TRAP-type uncharacterized transport system substrate-binding protein
MADRRSERATDGTPTLTFGLQNPRHPWWWLGERIAEALVGFTDQLLPGVRVSLTTPPALQGALYNPIEVSAGSLTFGVTTPSVSARMATEGTGPFGRPYPGLRAIATYPHRDYVVLAVDEALGVSTLEQVVERRLPLQLVTGRRSGDGVPDVLTFAIAEILRLYGTSYEEIETWGGRVVFGGPTHVGGLAMLDGSADALFHEAQMSPIWGEIAAARRIRVLPIRDDVREHLLREYGFERAEVPAGHASGATVATPTIDFSGWLLLCREDLPDEWAYAVARACDETRDLVEADQGDRHELELPIDPRDLFGPTAVPLHPGAQAYAVEKGYVETDGRSSEEGLT